jgi:hypothetical protein
MNSRSSTRRAIRAVFVLALSLAAATSSAVGITSERMLASIIQQTPKPILVARGQEMIRAEAAAANIPGAEALWGVGASMAPLYSSRTAIVVAPVKFADLKKGMTVVYVDGRGRRVAHALTGDLPQGWVAQGVNNDEEDADLVTPENLVGVIVQAYAETPSEFRVALTRELVAQGRLAANPG